MRRSAEDGLMAECELARTEPASPSSGLSSFENPVKISNLPVGAAKHLQGDYQWIMRA